MKKIIEFALKPVAIRRKFWQEHLAEYLEMQFLDMALSKEALKKDQGRILQEIDGALISEDYAKIFFEIYPDVSRRLLEGRRIDCLIRERGGVFPQCLLRESLHELIVQKTPQLNVQMRAYITGSDSAMRVALATAVQIGFSEINIVVENVALVEAIVAELQQQFLLVNFHVLKNTDLTLQPNNGSLLVNTVKLEGQSDFLEDLSYLNFISLDGLVVDTCATPGSSQLLSEARHVGLRTLDGLQLQGHMDWQFLRKVFGKVSLDAHTYLEKWMAAVKNKSFV